MTGKASVGEPGKTYNIFISWSGPRSERVAEALRDWLPLVLQSAKPWMSTTDIEKGSRGIDEVSTGLQGMKVGIVCLTPENLNAPWILYEAGALSKTIDDKTRLCTYLLGGLRFQDVEPPLGLFQATKPEKADTLKLVRTINRAISEDPVPEGNLDRLFERMWPDLEKKLSELPQSEVAAAPKRTVNDMVTEILEIARREANYRETIREGVDEIRRDVHRRNQAAFWGEPGLEPTALSGVPARTRSLRDILGGVNRELEQEARAAAAAAASQPQKTEESGGRAHAPRPRSK